MKRAKKKKAAKRAKKSARSAKRTARTPRRGLMFVLSSPSGAGKTTLTRLLLGQDKRARLSVSVTTRERRPSEVDGVHYTFVDRKTFIAMRDAGELLEWAEVHGNLYATPRFAVEKHLAAGHDVIFDIDWQGTLQLYEQARKDVTSVFILPPSMAELRTRLSRRAEDDEATIRKRLKNAVEEIGHWKEYDYVLANNDLNRCFSEVKTVLAGARAQAAGNRSARGRRAMANARKLLRDQQPKLAALVKRLQTEKI